MTIEDLKKHCIKTIKMSEAIESIPNVRVTDNRSLQEHKLVLQLIETLEQEPCEDCISRQAAIDTIESWLTYDDYNEAERHIMRAMQSVLYDLPSVTPKEKTGKWESTEIFYGGESKGAIIKCSECGNEFKVSPKVFENLYGNERFCNHCGARMVSE